MKSDFTHYRNDDDEVTEYYELKSADLTIWKVVLSDRWVLKDVNGDFIKVFDNIEIAKTFTKEYARTQEPIVKGILESDGFTHYRYDDGREQYCLEDKQIYVTNVKYGSHWIVSDAERAIDVYDDLIQAKEYAKEYSDL